MACWKCCHDACSCDGCPEQMGNEPHLNCVNCGFSIYEGEPYWDLPGGIVCDVCIDNMTGRDLGEYLGYAAQEMTRDEIDARRDNT